MRHLHKALAALLLLLLVAAALPAMAERNARSVKIDRKAFPDARFRTYVAASFDANGDGMLSSAELKAVTEIDFTGRKAKSLKGIEYFTKLKTLRCGDNGLTALDVSKNVNLTELDCAVNKLSALDLRKNTKLTLLDCGYNRLASLDVRKNKKLARLQVYANRRLSELNLGRNQRLR